MEYINKYKVAVVQSGSEVMNKAKGIEKKVN